MATKKIKTVANPYYEIWKKFKLTRQGLGRYDVPFGKGGADWLGRMMAVHTTRDLTTRKYSWAIPSPKSIKWIVKRAKSIVEIGAGRGYWAKLLAEAGAEVFAYDISVVKGRMGKNGYHNPRSKLAPDYLSSPEDEPGTLFYPVKRGGAICAADHPDSTLMLCWPPLSSPMARQCLNYYQGRTLIYIGEWDGCCADSKFFEQLKSDWKTAERFEIPQWPGIRDDIWYLERK